MNKLQIITPNSFQVWPMQKSKLIYFYWLLALPTKVEAQHL